jgi:hypothetical protein
LGEEYRSLSFSLCSFLHSHNNIPHLFYIIMKQYLKCRRWKVQFTLQQATKAQRGSRGIAVLFL